MRAQMRKLIAPKLCLQSVSEIENQIGGLLVNGRIDDGFYVFGRKAMSELIADPVRPTQLDPRNSLIHEILQPNAIQNLINMTSSIMHTYSSSVFPKKYQAEMYSKYMQKSIFQIVDDPDISVYKPKFTDLRSKSISNNVAREIEDIGLAVKTAPAVVYNIRGKPEIITNYSFHLYKTNNKDISWTTGTKTKGSFFRTPFAVQDLRPQRTTDLMRYYRQNIEPPQLTTASHVQKN